MRMKWIYHYSCGCSDGPKFAREMLKYCGTHGGDLRERYPIISSDKADDNTDAEQNKDETMRR